MCIRKKKLVIEFRSEPIGSGSHGEELKVQFLNVRTPGCLRVASTTFHMPINLDLLAIVPPNSHLQCIWVSQRNNSSMLSNEGIWRPGVDMLNVESSTNIEYITTRLPIAVATTSKLLRLATSPNVVLPNWVSKHSHSRNTGFFRMVLMDRS